MSDVVWSVRMAKTIMDKKEKERQVWLELVEQLLHQIESWAENRRWQVRRDEKRIEESKLGTYRAPVLSILTPVGQIHVEPIARYVARGDGRVDLLAWPSLTRMLLVREGNRWAVKTDSGVNWP